MVKRSSRKSSEPWTLPASDWEDPLKDIQLVENLAERMEELKDQIMIDEGS